MSLIVVSSSQDEHDQNSKQTTGLENPASFQNFFNSPLIVEKNSEVAVVSLKCARDTDTIEVKEGDGIFLYWGAEDSQNMNENTAGNEKPVQSDDIHTPLRILLRKGTYTRANFVTHLKARLETIVFAAYKEVGTINVTQTFDSNVFTGFSIQFIQVGNGTAFADKPSVSEFGAYIDEETETSIIDDTKFTDVDQYTDNFVASASGTDVLITGYNAGSEGPVCDVIGQAHPLSQVNSKCIIYFNGSSADGGEPDGYTLGLVRSQGRLAPGSVKKDYAAPGGVGTILGSDNYADDVNIPNLYDPGQGGVLGVPPFFWDVAFNWVPGEDGQVIHYVNDNEEDDTVGQIQTVTLATTPTNASLTGKYWDRVEFHVVGETVKVYLGQTGKAALDTLVNGSLTAFGSRVKPIGQTCNQLYPKIAIHNNDDTNPGTAWLTTWNGHSDLAYYNTNYWGYTDLDTPTRAYEVFRDSYTNIDLSTVYGDGTMSDESTLYTYKGELNGNRGIANKWVFLTGDFNGRGQYTDYFNSDEQMSTLADDGQLQDILGFDAIMTETQFGTSADHGTDITFSSVKDPGFLPRGSMFVRLKNQALTSYNGNRRGISNIIYSCPRFDSLGNSAGLLFYEPAERVYVKLNNATRQMLNSLEIDIVDVNEKVIDSLVGNTLVVLHVRESK